MTYIPVKTTLPTAGALAGANTVVVTQGGVDKRTTLTALQAFVLGTTTPSPTPTPTPTPVATTEYQKTTAYALGSTNPGANGSLTLTLPGAVTAGSNLLLMFCGGKTLSNVAIPTGWTKIFASSEGDSGLSAYYAPSSVLSGSSLTFSGIADVLNAALIETSAQSFEAYYGPMSGANSASYSLTAQASSTPSARYGMMTSFTGGVIGALTGATSLTDYPGVYTNPSYSSAKLFSIPVAGTGLISGVPANAAGTQPKGFIVNCFGAAISGLTGHYAYTPGRTATPTTIPAPVGGRPQYYTDYVARWKAGAVLPPPQVGMYNGPANQFVEKANFTYWLQRSVDVLEFAAFESFTGGNSMNNSASYAFGYQLSLGAGSNNCTFSIGVCTNDTNLYDVASGAYDDYYATVAQTIITKGGAGAEIRLGWEMNEQYYSFAAQNKEVEYRAAFRRIVFIMRQQPGAQFLFTFCPLLVGYTQGSDPNNYLPGADAIDFIGGDYYPSAYLGADHASNDASLWQAGSSSVSWMDGISQQYGVPMTFGEFAAGNNRDDGKGVGDDPYYLTEFHDWQKNNNKPVFRFNYWESSGGGTNSKMAPYDDGTATLFPLTAAQYLAYYRGPVTAAGYPARPAPPVNFHATGNLTNGFAMTFDAISSAGGPPRQMVVQFCEHGTNNWTTWNGMHLGSGQTVSPNRTLTAGTTQVDMRVMFTNSGGVSAWSQLTIDMGTGNPIGSPVIYSSAYGNNNTATPDPAITTPAALPNVSGSPSPYP